MQWRDDGILAASPPPRMARTSAVSQGNSGRDCRPRPAVRMVGTSSREINHRWDPSMANKPTDWTGLTLSDGRYRFESKLGEGGMGIVYRAHDMRLGMDVVIKVPRRAMLDDPAFADRVAPEVRSLVRLVPPH